MYVLKECQRRRRRRSAHRNYRNLVDTTSHHTTLSIFYKDEFSMTVQNGVLIVTDGNIGFSKCYLFPTILNSNINTVVTNMNNIESNTDFDRNNEDIGNENRNINISDNENNSIITNNVVNNSIVLNSILGAI
ncbi:hypothetical protein H8356DRAFT_1344200 [Neocallimastix lanati (nom. inval.)]|nr:hypothetical protein H8356DRAFT_1344200 [Neocallimastix sp. JGI-2020a]